MSFVDMIFTKSIRSFDFRVLVLNACLLMAGMLGEPSAILAGEVARTHALLINGGGNRQINYQSHLLHVNRIYGLLGEAGVPGNQISILSADGADPVADMATREVQKETDFWMLSGTRLERTLRPRITYTNSEVGGASLQSATRESLQAWFESAASSLSSGDTLHSGS